MINLRILSVMMSLFIFSNVSGRCIYVSSSKGEDNNTGLSENSPVKTIGSALYLEGDTICLKAGDVFYENIQFSNKVVTRYGKGHNPLLSGYKQVLGRKWEKINENIWMLDLADSSATGHIKNDMKTPNDIVNNIGFIHEIDGDAIHGRKMKAVNELESNWDFCQPVNVQLNPKDDYRYIYLYFDSDPNKLNLEYATGTIAVIMNGGTLDGISIQGFGFGISLRYTGTIKNCRIDAIGGRTLVTATNFICDGNGIGIWIAQEKDTENVLVEGCYISRVFDAGICMQGSSGGKATARNVICKDNLIVHCCQAWEDVLNNNPDQPYENCVFENNYAIYSGITSWGYYDKRYKYCHVLGNNRGGIKKMLFKNNLFINGNLYCSSIYNEKYTSNIWQNNNCYMKTGDYLLSHCDGYRDVLRIKKQEFKNIISEYRLLTGDVTSSVFVKSDKALHRKSKRTIRHYLRRHSY